MSRRIHNRTWAIQFARSLPDTRGTVGPIFRPIVGSAYGIGAQSCADCGRVYERGDVPTQCSDDCQSREGRPQ